MPHPLPLHFFFISMLIINLCPGPAMLFVVNQSLRHGKTAGTIATFGVETGTLIHVLLTSIGLSLILLNHGFFNVLQLAGAIYLIYLGIANLRTTKKSNISSTVSDHHLFKKGMLVNLLNPKILVFLFAFLPQFINPLSPYKTFDVLLLGLTFNLGGLLVNLGASSLAHTLFSQYTSSRNATILRLFERWIPSILFFALGLSMLYWKGIG